nr:hypothetical protein [Candidatus Sigynarchaeota archaeon]
MQTEKKPWLAERKVCGACMVPGRAEKGPPLCKTCSRNPLNTGRRLPDWFSSKIGDNGDCGNWAIAFQRRHGGNLFAVWDAGDGEDEVFDPPILGHVCVVLGDLVHDVYGAFEFQAYYEAVFNRWLYYPMDIEPIDEITIFERLGKTSEARINELMGVV